MRVWMVDFCASMVVLAVGTWLGWWLRGRHARRALESDKQRQVAEHALRGLQSVTDSVQSCLAEHSSCIVAIDEQLRCHATSEPNTVSVAADEIVAANSRAHDRFSDIKQNLNRESETLRRYLDHNHTLLLTTISLNRQKKLFRDVLTALQTLASEISRDIDGHGQVLQRVNDRLDGESDPEASAISRAITQIMEVTEEMQHRIAQAEERIEEQSEQVQRQTELANTDLLTALPNRRAFDDALRSHAQSFHEGGQPYSIALIDLDRFKSVNDSHGHPAGDAVLRHFARLLERVVRSQDVVARFGGEEFALLFADTTLLDARRAAERIRHAIGHQEVPYGELRIRVTTSVGVSQALPGEDRSATIKRADEALYAAKGAGRNRTWWHDGEKSYPVEASLAMREPATLPSPPPVAEPTKLPPEADAEPTAGEETPLTEEELAPAPAPRRDWQVDLSGRSVFFSNLKRRLAEAMRGGSPVTVILLRIDQYAKLVSLYDRRAHDLIRGVVGRLLEGSTREMDERCDYDEQTFAVLVPGVTSEEADRIAMRLQMQVAQCELRLSEEPWQLTASLGVAHCQVGETAMGLLLRAEAALHLSEELGGNATHTSESPQSAFVRTPTS